MSIEGESNARQGNGRAVSKSLAAKGANSRSGRNGRVHPYWLPDVCRASACGGYACHVVTFRKAKYTTSRITIAIIGETPSKPSTAGFTTASVVLFRPSPITSIGVRAENILSPMWCSRLSGSDHSNSWPGSPRLSYHSPRSLMTVTIGRRMVARRLYRCPRPVRIGRRKSLPGRLSASAWAPGRLPDLLPALRHLTAALLLQGEVGNCHTLR